MTNKKIVYTDEPMGRLRLVKDFLPPPDQLVLKQEEPNPRASSRASKGGGKPRNGKK